MDRTSRSALNALSTTVLIVALTGCETSLDRSEAIGSWECRRGARVSCIDIRDDNTYSQVITVNGVRELETTSAWDWELKAGDGMAISFNRFHHLADDGSEIKRPPGFWIVVPERTVPFGVPKLEVSDDISIAYTKRTTQCPR